MGKIRLQKSSEEFELFQDYWKFFQEYLKVEDTEEYWEKAIEAGKGLLEKHKSPFARDLIVAYMNELERRGKNEGLQMRSGHKPATGADKNKQNEF